MARADGSFRQNRIDYDTVTIASSGTVSTAINLDGCVLIGIITPSVMTGTAISFQFSHDDSTYTALYNTSGSVVSLTSAASRWIGLDKEDFLGAKSLKVVSGSTEVAERTITLVLMRA